MKKFTFALSLILCLVLCLFAFASCGKKSGGDAATEAKTDAATEAKTDAATDAKTDAATDAKTDAATEAKTDAATDAETEPATDAETEPVTDPVTEFETEHVHVPEEEYTIDTPATCTEPGSMSYHCSACGEIIEETIEVIEAKGHTPADEYTIDTPATCTEPGSMSYHCVDCLKIIEETVTPIAAKGHTPSDKYTVDVPATCSGTGTQSYHCVDCNAVIDGTSVTIDINPDAHVVTEWENETIPTLLSQEGSRDGECSLCHTPVHEDLTWEPEIFCSSDPKGSYYDAATGNFTVSKTIAEFRGEKHFFPVSEEDLLGNDLWFEYSLLWNETLANTASARVNVAQFNDCELYGFYTRDDAALNEFGGHFDVNKTFVYGSANMDAAFKDGAEWSSYLSSPWACVTAPIVDADPTYKGSLDPDATAESYPAIGGYGWHRIGFRFHAEAVASTEEDPIPAANKDGLKAYYTGYSELYIDGVRVWQVETSLRGYWNAGENKWSGQSYALIPNRAATFFANGKGTVTGEFEGAIEFRGVQYVDFDKVKVNCTIAKITDSADDVYVVIDDPQWTCGQDFVRNVQPVAEPEAQTMVLADGVEVSAAVWFKLAD